MAESCFQFQYTKNNPVEDGLILGTHKFVAGFVHGPNGTEELCDINKFVYIKRLLAGLGLYDRVQMPRAERNRHHMGMSASKAYFGVGERAFHFFDEAISLVILSPLVSPLDTELIIRDLAVLISGIPRVSERFMSEIPYVAGRKDQAFWESLSRAVLLLRMYGIRGALVSQIESYCREGKASDDDRIAVR